MFGQCMFYLVALAGHWISGHWRVPALLRLPVFFVGMNLALLLGFFRYVGGRFSGAWVRSAR
jgi:hypothetical protein